MSRLALVTDLVSSDLGPAVADLHAHLARCGVATTASLADADAVAVWADRPPAPDFVDALLARAAAGIPLLLCGPTTAAYAEIDGIAEAAGIVTGRQTPVHETRLRTGPAGQALMARVDGDVLVTDRWLALEKVRDDVEVLASVDGHPVLCRSGSVLVSAFHPELSHDLRIHALFLGD